LLGIAIELVLICALIYVPFLQGVFNTAPIGIKEWIMLLVIPPVIILIEETRKAFSRKYGKNR